MRILIVVLGLIVLGGTILAVPARSQGEETVSATVSVQSVSLTVSPNSIDYGTLPFEASRSSTDPAAGGVTFVATNTGNVSENLVVRGSAATGSGFTWTLIDGAVACGSPTNNNKFRHSVKKESDPAFFLTTIDQTLATGLGASGTASFTSEIFMPCNGSDGVGQSATTSIVVTAMAP